MVIIRLLTLLCTIIILWLAIDKARRKKFLHKLSAVAGTCWHEFIFLVKALFNKPIIEQILVVHPQNVGHNLKYQYDFKEHTIGYLGFSDAPHLAVKRGRRDGKIEILHLAGYNAPALIASKTDYEALKKYSDKYENYRLIAGKLNKIFLVQA